MMHLIYLIYTNVHNAYHVDIRLMTNNINTFYSHRSYRSYTHLPPPAARSVHDGAPSVAGSGASSASQSRRPNRSWAEEIARPLPVKYPVMIAYDRFCRICCDWIGSRETIYRRSGSHWMDFKEILQENQLKALFLMGAAIVSCRFSLTSSNIYIYIYNYMII